MKKIYILFLFCSATLILKAQWNSNTNKNTVVANLDASDIQTANTNDGKTWIAFYSQNGSNYDMRAQLLDAAGRRTFADTGVLVSNKKSGSATFVFNVCVDNDNNFVIAYQIEKNNSYECVIQKISPSGKLMWSKSGVDLGGGLSPYPVTLSTNEIAVAWNDNNGKIDYQKISASGVAAWSTPKIFSGNSTHSVSRAQLVAGTNGKFNMVYQDQFSFPFYTHLFEQKFDNDGNALWSSAVQISTLATASYRYYDVLGENDTTYVGYYGNPSGTNRFDAYLQRVNPNGSLPYGANGSGFAPGFSGNNDPYEQTIYIAKKPGAWNVWAVCTITNSLQTASGVYVQKFDAASGLNQYGSKAHEVFPISQKLISLAFCQLSLCDNNPVFLTTSTNNKLVAVKINGSDGSTAFVTGLGTSTNSKFRYGFTDFNRGQAVAVWQEDKGDGNKPYAQNIKCDGSTGSVLNSLKNSSIAENTLSIKSVYPNPVQNSFTATITSSTQTAIHIYITNASGNVMKQLQQNVQKGDNQVSINVSNLKAGSYFIKVTSGNISAGTLITKN